ncbi:YfjI family protein [Planctomycetaceae bacterium]|nr:YfjI family protein [Planctomycetaceae bacterium]
MGSYDDILTDVSPPPTNGHHSPDGRLTWKQSNTQEYAPFPVDELPIEVASLVCEAATSIGCDPAMVAVPALAAMAGAIGRSRSLLVKQGWFVPPVIWLAVVAESGSSKTPAIKAALAPLRDAAREAIERNHQLLTEWEAALADYDAELKAWKKNKADAGEEMPAKPTAPILTRYIVSDATVESLAPILLDNPRGLLLDRDELATWLGSFDRYSGGKGADAGAWLSMHSAEGFTIDRKTGRRTIHVPAAAVSIIGGIQPAILREHLAGEHRQNGLSARLLMTAPPQSPKVWRDDEISEATMETYAGFIRRLLALWMPEGPHGPQPVYVEISGAAKAHYQQWYNSHNREASEQTGELRAAYSKIEELPLRLALILHCATTEDETEPIHPETMRAAIRIADWFKGEAVRVREIMAGASVENAQAELIQWIQRQGGEVTVRELQQSKRKLYPSSDDAESALRELSQSGIGTWETLPAGPQGGHPKTVFRLAHDAITEHTTR